jgi:hypothetical protein
MKILQLDLTLHSEEFACTLSVGRKMRTEIPGGVRSNHGT